MIAEPCWKTRAVQFLIWSSLLPFHKDTRELPWLQTYLCYSDCLGFHCKEDRIESFLRAQIIKHNFSLICLKNVLRLKLTTVLYLLEGIIAFGRGHWSKPVEVVHLTGVPLDGQPLRCSKDIARKREWERERDRESEGERWGATRLRELICQLKVCRTPVKQHPSAFSSGCVVRVQRTKTYWSLLIPPVWYIPIPVTKIVSLCCEIDLVVISTVRIPDKLMDSCCAEMWATFLVYSALFVFFGSWCGHEPKHMFLSKQLLISSTMFVLFLKLLLQLSERRNLSLVWTWHWMPQNSCPGDRESYGRMH